jgi:predicted enzyme related to lactoylglutathione lyase
MKSPHAWLLAALLLSPLALAAADAGSGAAPRPGKFDWVDLVTTDPDTAIKFYTETFGWTAQEVSGGRHRYTFLLNQGQPVAGVAYRRADDSLGERPARAGARWIGSIAVPDIEAAVKSVTAAGGRVLVAPRKIEGRGLQALVADPEGCLFGLIAREGGGRESDAAENEWVWAQLLSGKPATAIEFYRQALGYQIDEDTRSKRADDYLLSRDGYSCAGLTPLPEGQGTRAGWLGYLRVADTAETIAAAESLGARVLYRQDAPDRLQVAILADPLGGAIGIVSMPAGAGKEGAK